MTNQFIIKCTKSACLPIIEFKSILKNKECMYAYYRIKINFGSQSEVIKCALMIWRTLFCAKKTKQRLYSTIRLLWFSVAPFLYPRGRLTEDVKSLLASSGYSLKWCYAGAEEINCWIKSLFCFVQKKCSHCFIKFRLNHWWQMDYSDDTFHTCMDFNGTVTSLLVFIQNIIVFQRQTKLLRVWNDMGVSNWPFSFWGGVSI